MTVDISCIGHTTIDRVITTAATVSMPGGTSVYFSSAMAALDVRYSLVTSLAERDLSALHLLKERGVDIIVYPSPTTLFFENIYGNDPNDRTQRVLAMAEPFSPAQVTGLKAAVYHLGTLVEGDIPAETIRALASNGKVSLDVQGFLRRVQDQQVIPVDWTEKEALLPFVHFVKANEEEMAVLTGLSDTKEGAAKLAAWGAKEVIVTCGCNGSIIFAAGEFITIPAFAPQHLQDATGCGDTYMAGYIYKRFKGASIREAGEFAAAMATLKMEVFGPFSGTKEDVEALLKKAKQIAR